MDLHHLSDLSPGQIQRLLLLWFITTIKPRGHTQHYQGQSPAAQTPRMASSARRHSLQCPTEGWRPPQGFLS